MSTLEQPKGDLNPNQMPAQYKQLSLLIKIISFVLPVVVAILFGFKLDVEVPFNLYILPLINAILNGACAVLLIGALVAIKKKNVQLHKQMIYATMVLSLVFLLVYVTYHLLTPPTKYAGEYGFIYFPLLIAHIILAAVQPPFVLYAFLYGYTGMYEKHKKIVKWSYPIWLFVSISGVICYLMLAPFYPSL